MAVTKIEGKDFKRLAVESKKKVVVDCYAEWCGPCKMLGPVIDSLSEENTEYEFYKLDVDEAEEISKEYGVMSIPTLLIFNKGELINKSVGLISKEELITLLK